MTLFRARGTLLGCVALWGLVVSFWCLRLHGAWRTGIFDLGIHAQALELLGPGSDPWLNTRGLPLLADHFLPVLWLLAPLCRPPGPAAALLVVQAFALALGALPVFGLARRALSRDDEALGWALAYLAHPALLGAALFEFHTSTLATPLLLTALWALHSGRRAAYWLCLPLVAACGEALALSVVALAWEPWRLGQRRTAGGTVLVGLLLGVLARAAMAAASGGAASQYTSLYGSVGFDFTMPLYVALLCLPLLGLPLLGWRGALPALPVVLGNLLSWRDNQRSLDNHYQAAVLPFLFWGAMLAWPRLRGRVRLGALAALLGAWALANNIDRGVRALPRPVTPALGRELTLSAGNGPGAHYSDRDGCWMFPNPFWPCCWGNRPESLHETAGEQCPPEPAEFLRALASCAVDRVVLPLQAASPWPLTEPDTAYLMRLLDGSDSWRRSAAGPDALVWQRVAPGAGAPLGWARCRPAWSGDGRCVAWESTAADGRLQPRGRSERYRLFFWQPGESGLLHPALPPGSLVHPRLGATAAEWTALDRDRGLLWRSGQALGEGYAAELDGRWLSRSRQLSGYTSVLALASQGCVWLDGGGRPHLGGLLPDDPVGASPALARGGELVWSAPDRRGRWHLDGRRAGRVFRVERTGHCLEPSLSADGRWLAYTWMHDGGRSDVCLRDLDSGAERVLSAPGDDSTFAAALAPDGRSLVAVTLASKLGPVGDSRGRLLWWRDGAWRAAAPLR